jgi:2-dehydropantoate 2-reductase
VYGAGAVGGVVGAGLHQSGRDVTLVARGAHLQALRERGLRVEGPDGASTYDIPAVGDVARLKLTADDVVLIATKSQHTDDVLQHLGPAAPPELPVVCLQNGVENERRALRYFANVYGVCVMCPATHLTPGVVVAHRAPVTGILDLGRYPAGVDDLARAIAAWLGAAGFVSEPRPDILRWKYAKLLLNLANALEVVCGPGHGPTDLARRARDEGVACLTAAGIPFVSEDEDRARRAELVPRGGGRGGGGSSWQSVVRGTGDVEADFLNGEIVRLGRAHGVPTPVNAALQRLAGDIARRRAEPGSLAETDVLRLSEGSRTFTLPGQSGRGPLP